MSDEIPTSEAIGMCVSALGIVLTLFVGLPVAIIAGAIHTPASLAWGLPTFIVPIVMTVGGLIFVPPTRK